MNFIIRNLGWILLIIFFTFMLYLISNQNNTKKIINTNSGAIIETINTGTASKIDENKLAIKKYNLEKYNVTKTGTIEIKESSETNETGFIQSVRNFFTIKKSENKTISNEVEIKSEKIVITDLEKNKIEITKTTDLAKIETDISKIAGNLVNTEISTISNKEIIKKISEVKNNENTTNKKIDETKIDKTTKNTINKKELSVKEKITAKIKTRNKNRVHTVGVKSVFLNNAYFTKRLATAYRGDNLEQLTNTNKYGCFKTEILEAKNKKIEGLRAWTCIYYMKGFLGTQKNYNVAAKIYNRNVMKKIRTSNTISKKIEQKNKNRKIYRAEDGSIITHSDPYKASSGPIYNTEVGSKYLVRVNSLKLNNGTFTSTKGYLEKCTSKNCDILEQLTPVNRNGCFKINVYKSNTQQNKRGWVCQKYVR